LSRPVRHFVLAEESQRPRRTKVHLQMSSLLARLQKLLQIVVVHLLVATVDLLTDLDLTTIEVGTMTILVDLACLLSGDLGPAISLLVEPIMQFLALLGGLLVSLGLELVEVLLRGLLEATI